MHTSIDRSDNRVTLAFLAFFGFLAYLLFQSQQKMLIGTGEIIDRYDDDVISATSSEPARAACALCKAVYPDEDAPVGTRDGWSMVSFGNSRPPLFACCDAHMEGYIAQGGVS